MKVQNTALFVNNWSIISARHHVKVSSLSKWQASITESDCCNWQRWWSGSETVFWLHIHDSSLWYATASLWAILSRCFNRARLTPHILRSASLIFSTVPPTFFFFFQMPDSWHVDLAVGHSFPFQCWILLKSSEKSLGCKMQRNYLILSFFSSLLFLTQ